MGSLSMTDHVSLANRFHLACASRLRFLFCARTGRGAPGDLLPKFGDVGGLSLPYREKVPDARRGPACCCFEPTCMSTSAHASVLWVSLHGLRACHLGVGSALTSGCMPLVPVLLVSIEVWFPLVWLLAVPRRPLGVAALVSPPPGTCVQPDPDFGPFLAFSCWCHAWSHRRVFPAVPLWGLALLVSPPASGMQTHQAGEQ